MQTSVVSSTSGFIAPVLRIIPCVKKLGEEVLGAQLPVLSCWALATVIARTATTLMILAILILGV